MKKTFTLFLMFGLVSMAWAQSNVYLKINHKLGDDDFAFSTTASNNLGNDFELGRMEYYISEITLIHDGGMETPVTDKYLLVDGGTMVNEDLGSFSITSLEGVKFGIGVDAAHNHLDPASYPASHPLAPKAPSMHWGWSAGYRFVAMEGMAGSSLSQLFEIHALGDANYHYATVMTSGTTSGSDLIIELDADYTMAVKDIDISAGMVNHGESGSAATLLDNFRDYVFTETSPSVGVEDELCQDCVNFLVAPNPTSGTFRVILENGNVEPLTVSVTDLNGRLVRKSEHSHAGNIELNLDNTGLYFITLSQEGSAPITRKLIVRN